MKLNINESKMLTEMAKIGSISNKVGQTGNYFIYVYGNKKKLSHIFILRKKQELLVVVLNWIKQIISLTADTKMFSLKS